MEKITKIDLKKVLLVLLIGLIGFFLGSLTTMLITYKMIKTLL